MCKYWFKKSRCDIYNRYVFHITIRRLQWSVIDAPLPTCFFSISTDHPENTVNYEGKSLREITNVRSSSRKVTVTSVGLHPLRIRRTNFSKNRKYKISREFGVNLIHPNGRTDRRDEANSRPSLANALEITTIKSVPASLLLLSSKKRPFSVKTFTFTYSVLCLLMVRAA
jgi:hypothetical protein